MKVITIFIFPSFDYNFNIHKYWLLVDINWLWDLTICVVYLTHTQLYEYNSAHICARLVSGPDFEYVLQSVVCHTLVHYKYLLRDKCAECLYKQKENNIFRPEYKYFDIFKSDRIAYKYIGREITKKSK